MDGPNSFQLSSAQALERDQDNNIFSLLNGISAVRVSFRFSGESGMERRLPELGARDPYLILNYSAARLRKELFPKIQTSHTLTAAGADEE